MYTVRNRLREAQGRSAREDDEAEKPTVLRQPDPIAGEEFGAFCDELVPEANLHRVGLKTEDHTQRNEGGAETPSGEPEGNETPAASRGEFDSDGRARGSGDCEARRRR